MDAQKRKKKLENSNFSLRRENKLKELIKKYDISPFFYQKLQILQGFKIVFIFDDSGSMNTPLLDSPLNNKNKLFNATRWNELQYFANISLEIASLFDQEGSDVYFLNRSILAPYQNVRSAEDIADYFEEKPQGIFNLLLLFLIK